MAIDIDRMASWIDDSALIRERRLVEWPFRRAVAVFVLLAASASAQTQESIEDAIVSAGLHRVIQEQTQSSDTVVVAPYFWGARGPADRVQLSQAAGDRIRTIPRAELHPTKYDECRLKTGPGCVRANGRSVSALLTAPRVNGNAATLHVTLEIATAGKTERDRRQVKAALFLVSLERSGEAWTVKSVRQVGGS